MEEKPFKSIDKKLGAIIALLSRLRIRESETLNLRSQIKLLDDIGLSPKEIAGILGRSSNYINKERSKLRSKAKKK